MPQQSPANRYTASSYWTAAKRSNRERRADVFHAMERARQSHVAQRTAAPTRRARPAPERPAFLEQPVLESLETTVLNYWRRQQPENVTRKHLRLAKLEAAARDDRDRERVQAMRSCSTGYAIVETDEGPRLQCNRCRERLCTQCQRVRAYKYQLAYERELRSWKHGKFLTLTIKTENEPVGKTITKLFKYFKRLRQHSVWKQLVRGGYTVVEITQNKETKAYHVHLHVLMDADYLPKDWLHETWNTITGGSWSTGISSAGLERAQYMAKYVGKTCSAVLDGDAEWSMADELKGRRLAQPFGNVPPLNQDANDDLDSPKVLDTLPNMLDRAAAGDPEAQHIIAQLHEHYGQLPGERAAAPPPPDRAQLELGTES